MDLKDATYFRNLLHFMLGGQHKVFKQNGHKIRVVCSMRGERYLIIDGETINEWDPKYVTKVTAKLARVGT